MPAKEKHAKSFVLLSQNVALNKTSGGRFYRSAMQGGMCDVMAYKNDSGDQSYVSWANKGRATYIFCIMQSPDTCDDYGYSNRRPALYETTKLIDWVFESFSIQPRWTPTRRWRRSRSNTPPIPTPCSSTPPTA